MSSQISCTADISKPEPSSKSPIEPGHVSLTDLLKSNKPTCLGLFSFVLFGDADFLERLCQFPCWMSYLLGKVSFHSRFLSFPGFMLYKFTGNSRLASTESLFLTEMCVCIAHNYNFKSKKVFIWAFPDSPLVKKPHFHCRGHGFDPWLGTMILYAVPCSQKLEKKTKIKNYSTW